MILNEVCLDSEEFNRIMEFCSWTRALELSSPASSFIDEENDPQRDFLSWPEKVQLMKGISLGIRGELPVLAKSCCVTSYHYLAA